MSLWTPERAQTLRDMREAGASFQVIADELNCGLTRNACIGRASRDRLPKTKPVRSRIRVYRNKAEPKPAKKRAKRRGYSIAPDFIELPLTAYFRSVPLVDLDRGMCRYPQGDGLNITFCGQPAMDGASWCQQCARIVYAPRNSGMAGRGV
jgi:hypothetical protein